MHDPDEDPEREVELGDEQASSPSEAGETTPLLDELLAEPREPAPESRAPAPPLQTRVGRLVEWTSGQAPKVEFPGNERGPLAARSILPLDPTTIAEAIQSGRGVVLNFEDGRPDAPIITGLLHDFENVTEAPQIWDESAPNQEEEQEVELESNLAELEARVDGRRIELEAADEIVLRCGQASIVLRRNGRVVIRGTYVETRSRGVNRIKGGSVQIN